MDEAAGMDKLDRYARANLAGWDERAPAHAASPDYAFARFIEDPSYLSRVVRYDVPRLGDIDGARGVHLQCHIGTDTLSLARLGARMTGLDFSPAALAEARRLSELAGPPVDFVEAEVYSAADVLDRAAFDLVFTGIGALCWLPDVRRWAAVVADLLAPGGRLFIREGHPMLWTIRTSNEWSRRSSISRARMWRPMRHLRRPSATSGTTALGRSSPPCLTPGSN
jgi:SAM-dependent methyltransferase